jgi:hypothetical protein
MDPAVDLAVDPAVNPAVRAQAAEWLRLDQVRVWLLCVRLGWVWMEGLVTHDGYG